MKNSYLYFSLLILFSSELTFPMDHKFAGIKGGIVIILTNWKNRYMVLLEKRMTLKQKFLNGEIDNEIFNLSKESLERQLNIAQENAEQAINTALGFPVIPDNNPTINCSNIDVGIVNIDDLAERLALRYNRNPN